ncbi:MAG: hypothetical protein K2O32_03060 [Acetatifactor sp.]|nr:hypothetical protein [Acetatifactor sp.]
MLKRILGVLLSIVLMAAVPAGCGYGNVENADNVESADNAEKLVDYESLGIKEYEYPSEFSMGDNLETAITQLALSYESFDQDCVNSESWQRFFIGRYIQNSRLSFDYLDMLCDQNDGQISVEELNYIQYSLTYTELDFSSYVDGPINRYDASSSLNYGWISEYDYEDTDDGVIVTANVEEGYDGTNATWKYEITVELIKNPYSCFDGYSVLTVSDKREIVDREPDGSTHIFCGTDMMVEDHGDFAFEYLYSEDDLCYWHIVHVDMTGLPEMAEYVRQNAGKEFRVTFLWTEGNANAIGRVVPVDIVPDEHVNHIFVQGSDNDIGDDS